MQRKGDQGRRPADFETVKSELSERLQHEAQTATEALDNTRDEFTRQAVDYASEAKQALLDSLRGHSAISALTRRPWRCRYLAGKVGKVVESTEKRTQEAIRKRLPGSSDGSSTTS